MRVNPFDAGMTGYVFTYLRTRYGRAIMASSHYGNVIKHLEVEHLEPLAIPVIDSLVDDSKADIAEVFAMRDDAYRLDIAARAKFASLLGEPKQLAPETGYIVSSACFAGGRRRLEAYAHNPRARAIVERYERAAERIETIGKVASAFVPSRFKRVLADRGMPYLDSEPVFKLNPGVSKFLTPATRINPEKYYVAAGWLLIACSGQIYGLNGQTMLATSWHERKVVTQHIMRLVPDPARIRPGYLAVVLAHPTLGQPLIVSRAHGTSVPELEPADIEDLPIPRFVDHVEAEIAEMTERASQLRLSADAKEDAAVTRLEHELERRIRASPRRDSN